MIKVGDVFVHKMDGEPVIVTKNEYPLIYYTSLKDDFHYNWPINRFDYSYEFSKKLTEEQIIRDIVE